VSKATIPLAWELPRAIPLVEMVATAREAVVVAPGELVPPSLQLLLLSSTGETITVRVVEGKVPADPKALVYVRWRGAYEVLRRAVWPSRCAQLTLGAWPRLETAEY
jgi:hypothetical protein